MNLTDVLRKILVGRVIRLDELDPEVSEPFHVDDVRIDAGGRLILYTEGAAPIVFGNPANFNFTDKTPKKTPSSSAATEGEPEKKSK